MLKTTSTQSIASPENQKVTLAAAAGTARTLLARDAFSLAHFSMVIGVIAYAGAIHEIVAHPTDSLHTEWLIALAIGVVLFVGSTGSIYTATLRLTTSPNSVAIDSGYRRMGLGKAVALDGIRRCKPEGATGVYVGSDEKY